MVADLGRRPDALASAFCAVEQEQLQGRIASTGRCNSEPNIRLMSNRFESAVRLLFLNSPEMPPFRSTLHRLHDRALVWDQLAAI